MHLAGEGPLWQQLDRVAGTTHMRSTREGGRSTLGRCLIISNDSVRNLNEVPLTF